jgi:hypothetical protein
MTSTMCVDWVARPVKLHGQHGRGQARGRRGWLVVAVEGGGGVPCGECHRECIAHAKRVSLQLITPAVMNAVSARTRNCVNFPGAQIEEIPSDMVHTHTHTHTHPHSHKSSPGNKHGH